MREDETRQGQGTREQAGAERDDRQRRVEALQALAAEQRDAAGASAAAARGTGRPRRPLHRFTGPKRTRWFALSAVMVAALVVLAVLVDQLRPHTTSTPPLTHHRSGPDAVALNFPSDGVGCASQAMWSPDGKRLALLGRTSCAGSPGLGDLLGIYDTSAVFPELVRRIDLDAPVLTGLVPASVRNDTTRMSQVFINLAPIQWAPDGQSFALVVVAGSQAPGASTVTYYGAGVLTVATNGGSARLYPDAAFLAGVRAGRYTFGVDGPVQATYWRWDLTTGAAALVALPRALTYTWGAAGSLAPTQALPATPNVPPPAATPGPVGNPIGGQTFAIWQGGYVEYGSDRCPPQVSGPVPTPASVPTYYLLTLETPAWSPDGRYLYIGLIPRGRLTVTPPPTAMTGQGGQCARLNPAGQYGQLPVRDAGLASALTTLDIADHSSAQLAWGPNGRILAVEGEDPLGGVQASEYRAVPIVTLYDCQSGAVRARLTLGTLGQVDSRLQSASFGGFPTLAWAPDGRHLLLLDPSDGVLVIAGPHLLQV